MNLQLKYPARLSLIKWSLPLVILYTLLGVMLLNTYINWSSASFILGLLGLFIVTDLDKSRKESYRFAYAALFFGALAFFIPAKTILYLSFCCSLLFIAEWKHGRVNLLVVFVLALMAPIFQYLVNVFSFPIRLQLTSFAGKLLGFAGSVVSVRGNTIFYQGNEFSVDPACMGLSMMTTSLLLGVMFMGYFQKQHNKSLPVLPVISTLLVIALLNTVSNLFRMVILVHFTIMPEDMLHDAFGLVCLLCYVIVPSFFLTRYAVRTFGKTKSISREEMPVNGNKSRVVLFHVLMLTTLLFFSFREKPSVAANFKEVVCEGYSKVAVDKDILKLQNEKSLVYIKHITGFYTSEHNPMICWAGSGYSLKRVETSVIESTEVYTAVLEDGGGKLYTSWWYDNGARRTIKQMDWRWDAMKGADDYSIINITSTTKEGLLLATTEALRNNRFTPLVKSFSSNTSDSAESAGRQ